MIREFLRKPTFERPEFSDPASANSDRMSIRDYYLHDVKAPRETSRSRNPPKEAGLFTSTNAGPGYGMGKYLDIHRAVPGL
ncbi:hypothetical protein ANO14919_137400 [Xylariales sp. No.14919]|nr:hypothetical protein ANO14919_137400 [Xylariales sp. No.14919]